MINLSGEASVGILGLAVGFFSAERMGLPVFVAIHVVVLLAQALHFGFPFSDAAVALRTAGAVGLLGLDKVQRAGELIELFAACAKTSHGVVIQVGKHTSVWPVLCDRNVRTSRLGFEYRV